MEKIIKKFSMVSVVCPQCKEERLVTWNMYTRKLRHDIPFTCRGCASVMGKTKPKIEKPITVEKKIETIDIGVCTITPGSSRCEKFTECENFLECLNRVVSKGWKGFTIYKPEIENV